MFLKLGKEIIDGVHFAVGIVNQYTTIRVNYIAAGLSAKR